MLPILTNAAQECLSGQFVFIIFPGLQLDDWRDINVCIVWLGVLACWPECEGGGWQTRVTTSVLFNSISHLFSTEALSRCFTHSHAWEGSTIHLIFFCSVLFSFFFSHSSHVKGVWLKVVTTASLSDNWQEEEKEKKEKVFLSQIKDQPPLTYIWKHASCPVAFWILWIVFMTGISWRSS